MVRSTGEEDTTEMANAGGNETVVNVSRGEASVWRAMKQVILSYFSEKTTEQKNMTEGYKKEKRLFMPVLLQEMIGEPYKNRDSKKIPVSGVLFSQDPEMTIFNKERGEFDYPGILKIDSTYGHGEAVVNGLLPCDSYIVAMYEEYNLTYPNFVKKIKRLAPTTIGLKERVNPAELVKAPSLSKEAIDSLTNFSKYLEKNYGYPVDVEFVVSGDSINIVQCRPIVFNKNVKPTYIDKKN